jgi:hypothetical protein
LVLSDKNTFRRDHFGFVRGSGRQHAVCTAMASQNQLHPNCCTDSMLLSVSNAHGQSAQMLFPWKIFDTIEVHIMA